MTRISLVAALLGTVALVQPADAQRTCRQDCVGPICSEQCTDPPGAVVIEGERPSTDGRAVARARDPAMVHDRDVIIEHLRAPLIPVRPNVDIDMNAEVEIRR